MTRLTALRIAADERVFASSYGPVDGRFGLYIGTMDEAPSGWERPRDLITSEPIYATAKDAHVAAESIIARVRMEAAMGDKRSA